MMSPIMWISPLQISSISTKPCVVWLITGLGLGAGVGVGVGVGIGAGVGVGVGGAGVSAGAGGVEGAAQAPSKIAPIARVNNNFLGLT